MKHSIAYSSASLLLAIVILLAASGCGAPATPAVPTLDPTLVMHQAIQTVQAQITEDARLHPSATPTNTATALPTNTPLPTLTPTPAFTDTPASTNTPAATATKVPPALSAQFLYAATYPGNQREYTPNEKFSLALGFKNTGSIAWSAGYTIKMISFTGEATVQQEATLGKGVNPGEKGEFNLWAFGSETLGKHVWNFQVFTDSGTPLTGGYGYFTYTSK